MSHLEKNQNANQEVYETLNKGIILELKSLQIKEWHVGIFSYLIP